MWILTGASLVRSCLDVGVDGDELDLADAGVDHPVDGVEPGAADAHDLDHREIRARLGALPVQPRGRLRQRLEVARSGRQLDAAPAVRDRLSEPAAPARAAASGSGAASAARRLDVRLLPARDVLDRPLVRLGLRLGLGSRGRGVLGRLLLALAALLRLLLRCLGRPEQFS